MKQAVEFEECLKDSPRFRWEKRREWRNWERALVGEAQDFRIGDCYDSLRQDMVPRYAHHLPSGSCFLL